MAENPYDLIRRSLERPKPLTIIVQGTEFGRSAKIRANADGSYQSEDAATRWTDVADVMKVLQESFGDKVRVVKLIDRYGKEFVLYGPREKETNTSNNVDKGRTQREKRSNARAYRFASPSGRPPAGRPQQAASGLRPDPDDVGGQGVRPASPLGQVFRGRMPPLQPSPAGVGGQRVRPASPLRQGFGARLPSQPNPAAGRTGAGRTSKDPFNKLVNEHNEIVSLGDTASGAIFVKRVIDRRNRSSKEVVIKLYPKDIRIKNPSPEQAFGGSSEYYIYEFCNLLSEKHITSSILKMVKAPSVLYLNANQHVQDEEGDIRQLVSKFYAKRGQYPPQHNLGSRGSFATEFIDGMTLFSALTTGKLNHEQAFSAFFEVFFAIECLVRVGIMHQDLHLNNILVVNDTTSDGRSKRYEYVGRDGKPTTIYIPDYQYRIKIFDFDRGLKHDPRPFDGWRGTVDSCFDERVRNKLVESDHLRQSYADPNHPNRNDIDCFKFCNEALGALSLGLYPDLSGFIEWICTDKTKQRSPR
jgi:hypothetical protein